MRKLTAEEQSNIINVLEKKEIIYKDLQDELFDHFSCAIEDKWQEDATLSFTEVFHDEYKKFGIFGLPGVLEEREKSLSKHYIKVFLKLCLEWFKLPKIILSLFVIVAMIFTFRETYGLYVFKALTTLYLLFTVYSLILKMYKRKTHKESIVYLLDKVIYQQSFMNAFFIYIIPQFYTATPNFNKPITAILIALIFFFAFQFNYFSFYYIPKNRDKCFKQYYKIAN